MNIDEKNIDQLLIAYLLNELDNSSKEQVEQWVAESDDNLKKYQQISKIWQVSENSVHLNFNANKAWDKVSAQIETKHFFQNHWFRAAAILLILIGSYSIIKNINNTPETTVLFANAELLSDTLMDGSVIKLNKNSNLSYTDNFNSDTREIALTGEAFFDIKRDETKPFIINLERSKVQVLGTSFNIKSHPGSDTVVVYVHSGLVLFEYMPKDTTRPFESIKLKAGQKIVYNKITHDITENTDSLLNKLETYWINKNLVFDGIKLGKVAELLEVIYEVKIDFSNESLKNCLLTVGFEDEGIEQIIEVIATTFNFEIEKIDNKYILKGDSCEDN